VAEVLPELLRHLERGSNAVLVAPPGAGKTTLAPLALLDAPWAARKRILLLEPRRLAARAAATRMAELLGEEPGETAGWAMRMDRRMSERTRVLVVTEGLLSRMILDDPELTGVAAVLFDEFHERSLDADWGLALALDVQEALRPDLKLLAMSATLDGARVASLMGDAPVIESRGRSFPVQIRYRERPGGMEVEDAVTAAVRDALDAHEGGVLAFLPGQREIERTLERLQTRVAGNVDLVPLYGALDARAQDFAIRPAPQGRRKVVLATSIAETSLTIDGIRVVVDGGLSRVPRYEPATGLTRLETVRVSRAAAEQRAGRAGRTAPGTAIRLWREEATGALAPFGTPEILEADLSGLLLDAAAFGVADVRSLRFLDPPPLPALREAEALLKALGSLDADGRLTEAGRAMRKLALPARLAHMVAEAARGGQAEVAAQLAVLLSERGLGGDAVDLDERLRRFSRERGPRAEQARALAGRLARQAGGSRANDGPAGAGALLLHAWPDRVAKRRDGRGRFLLANGRGAALDENEPLAGADFLVVADLRGLSREGKIAAAAAVDQSELRAVLSRRIETRREACFDAATGSVRAVEREMLGALALGERVLARPTGGDADRAMMGAIRAHGLEILPWSEAALSLRARFRWLHETQGAPWPAMDDASLLADLDDWFAPFLGGDARLASLGPKLTDALLSRTPFELRREVDRLAPTHFHAPSGSRVPIRYEEGRAKLTIRVQELFGLDRHPAVGETPLLLELTSPAGRPIQTTQDLPGFWRGSWREVRAQLRGRYPKHPWPEDPLAAQPTARAKPRGT
jgi:ATP-dependent helicase HrpB